MPPWHASCLPDLYRWYPRRLPGRAAHVTRLPLLLVAVAAVWRAETILAAWRRLVRVKRQQALLGQAAALERVMARWLAGQQQAVAGTLGT